MKGKTTRRQFLAGAGVTAGWLAIAAARRLFGEAVPSTTAQEPQLAPRAYLPVVLSRYPPPKVVHIHAATATHWDFSSGWYGDQVDQAVVNEMVERGLMELAGASSVAAAWAAILPGYLPGQKVAIKVNLNNASCDDKDKVIDALIHPVNALIRTLVAAGVREEDVWVYAGKTVLTLADGLFGAPSVAAKPIPWQSWGNSAPNSLFFSRDPVAIDCVMCDVLRTEWGLDEAAYDYLRLAEERGLGRFERGDPWGGGYARLDYVRADL